MIKNVSKDSKIISENEEEDSSFDDGKSYHLTSEEEDNNSESPKKLSPEQKYKNNIFVLVIAFLI